jgi:hypothetical protein
MTPGVLHGRLYITNLSMAVFWRQLPFCDGIQIKGVVTSGKKNTTPERSRA